MGLNTTVFVIITICFGQIKSRVSDVPGGGAVVQLIKMSVTILEDNLIGVHFVYKLM